MGFFCSDFMMLDSWPEKNSIGLKRAFTESHTVSLPNELPLDTAL